jgi:hypothetical protein
VGLLWYRKSEGANAVGTIANFGSAPTHFDGSGNWSTGGIASPSISAGDKFTATGGFWSAVGSGSPVTSVDNSATYQGKVVRVECEPFQATRTWPF